MRPVAPATRLITARLADAAHFFAHLPVHALPVAPPIAPGRVYDINPAMCEALARQSLAWCANGASLADLEQALAAVDALPDRTEPADAYELNVRTAISRFSRSPDLSPWQLLAALGGPADPGTLTKQVAALADCLTHGGNA